MHARSLAAALLRRVDAPGRPADGGGRPRHDGGRRVPRRGAQVRHPRRRPGPRAVRRRHDRRVPARAVRLRRPGRRLYRARPRAAIGPDAMPAGDAGEMVLLWMGWDRHWGPIGTASTRPSRRRRPGGAPRLGGRWVSTPPAPTRRRPTGPVPTNRRLPAHRALLGADRLIVENLTNLAGLDRPTVRAFPLAIAGGDAAPVRAVVRE